MALFVLFAVISHTNMTDNIQHYTQNDHHDHTALSVVEDHAHADSVGEVGGSSEDRTGTLPVDHGSHFHPSSIGQILADGIVFERHTVFALPVELASAQYNDSPLVLIATPDRPPQV